MNPSGREPPANAMTVDVEDYFHVEAFKSAISAREWNSLPSRVEKNTDFILDAMERRGAHGTFFVLGWLAQRHPSLVRRIAAGGHEIASHGSDHKRADVQQPGEFRTDVGDAKKRLEDTSGVPVRGYRAPTFSIGRGNWWAYDVLMEAGYEYSSSIYPIAHDLYGLPDAPRAPFRPADGPLLEIPLTTVRLFRRNFPCSGGGYFRLLPYWYSRWGLRRVNQVESRPGVFYCHPWEIDPDQPRISGISMKSRLRHYTNLRKMPSRLERLLRDFRWDRMDRIFLPAA